MAELDPRALRWIRARIALVGAISAAVLCAHVVRAHQLQIKEGEKFRALAEEQYLRDVDLPPRRGTVLDRHGNELATSADVDSAYANPRMVPAGSAASLAPALGVPLREIEEHLKSRRYFTWLKRRITPEQARSIAELEIPGVFLIKEPRRYYPNNALAGPLLGFCDSDGHGIEGLELVLDQSLRGSKRAISGMRDALGRDLLTEIIPDVDETSGQVVTLTIDRFIQFTAERVLKQTVDKFRATAGTAIMIDVRTGEVLASATVPTYDPNKPGDGTKAGARNRAVTDSYEPGSTIKTFTVAAALDAGVVKPTDMWNCQNGAMKLGKYTIHDSHGHGTLSTSEVLKVSSNIGAAKIGKRLGAERLYESLKRFGFAQKSAIEMPGEQTGRLRNPANWGEIGLATVAFGQGLTATPLQIAEAYATVGNGGVYHAPRIVRASAKDPGRRVISEATAETVTRMLESVTEEGGTAATLKASLYKIAGKTGTAQKVDPSTRRYSATKFISSFAGFAPAHEPRIAMVVAIDEPTGQHFGSVVAAPAFQQIVEETLRYLGVAPAPERVAEENEKGKKAEEKVARARKPAPIVAPVIPSEPEADAPALDGDSVTAPDFTGMSIAQALTAARRVGLALQVEGSGRAVSQSVEPGPVPRGSACRVAFNAVAMPVLARAQDKKRPLAR